MSTKTTVDPTGFRHLLERWNTHQALRSSNAPIASLANSRRDLDEARDALRSTI